MAARGVTAMVVVTALGSAGCRQLFGIDDTEVARDGAGGDGAVVADASPIPDAGPCAGTTYGTGLLRICLAAPPTLPLTVVNGVTTIDTTVDATSPSCLPEVSAYCVVAGTAIRIADGSVLRTTGARPLVLVSSTSIEIDGTVDAASGLGSEGAGASAAPCTPAILPALGNGGGGGGAGGSFAGRGGAGAAGGMDPVGAGGAAAAAIPIATITTLRAGCGGDRGGEENGQAGAGGAGGGALYLIATDEIHVGGTGRINASGAPGRGGTRSLGFNGGAGGGGAGGMIGLDAPSIRNFGQIFANGGGAGEGGPSGANGATPASPLVAAVGGAGSGQGGDGGRGSVGAILDGADGQSGPNDGGGGGGGGAAGVILVYSISAIGGTVSPPPP